VKLTNSEPQMESEPEAGGDDEKKRDKKQETQGKYAEKTAEIENGIDVKVTLARFLDNWKLNMSTRTAQPSATTSSSSGGCTSGTSSSSSSKNTSLRDINISVHNTCNSGSGSGTPVAVQSPREGEL
jgi:BRCT domain type II-containing protein